MYRQVADLRTNRAALDTFPATLTNQLIQQLKVQLNELQRCQPLLGENYRDKHPEMLKVKWRSSY